VKPSQIALSGFARRLWEVAFGSWLWFPSRSGREEGHLQLPRKVLQRDEDRRLARLQELGGVRRSYNGER
jgi:hypothetical protein